MRAARGFGKAITTCSELKDCLVRAHDAVQLFNRSMGQPEQSCDFYLLNLSLTGTYEQKIMNVSDLCSAYALRMEGDTLFAYTNSMYKSRVEMEYSCTSAHISYRVIVPVYHPLVDSARVTLTLKKRRIRKTNLYVNAEMLRLRSPRMNNFLTVGCLWQGPRSLDSTVGERPSCQHVPRGVPTNEHNHVRIRMPAFASMFAQGGG